MKSETSGGDTLLAILGATGAGKTDLALRIADATPSEIIGADSRQVYRYMDIGTAKPTREQLDSTPHHLVDIVDPDYAFSLAEYARVARAAIRNVNAMGKTPILVGGTGQYVMAILEGWSVPSVPPNPDLRRRLAEELEKNGLDALLEELSSVDPAAMGAIDAANPRRVIRAIERALGGHPSGSAQRRSPPTFAARVIGLGDERRRLYERADRRLERMIADGFVGEVERLLALGYSPELPSMSGIGYSELIEHVERGAPLEESIRRAKRRTHRYIRGQANWFKRNDPRIRWFRLSETDAAMREATEWAAARGSSA